MKVKINTPDGKTIVLNAPDGSSPESVKSAAKKAVNDYKTKKTESTSLLDVPEQKSREGLKMLAEMASPNQEVTGNLPLDIAKNTPRIALETLSEVAPSFVSKESILTAAALPAIKATRPLLSLARRGAFSTLEKTSGLAPRNTGVLEEAYKDPTLIVSRSKKAAAKFYEAAKNKSANIFKGKNTSKEIVDSAEAYLERGGKLEPSEALVARKATDALLAKKDAVKDNLIPLRETFDKIAKKSNLIAKGDKIFERGLKAEALRNLLPTNVGGTFSSFRTAGGAAAANLIPGGKILAPIALSPAIQGAMATGLGVAKRIADPLLSVPVRSAISGGVGVGAFIDRNGKGKINRLSESSVRPGTLVKPREEKKPEVKEPPKPEVKKKELPALMIKPEVKKPEGKVLSEEKAKEFLREAKGDRAKARELAKKAGYGIPK